MSNKEKIDVPYILKTYWSFLKKYKLIAIALVFLAIILTLINYSTKYLMKVLIDNGALYLSKTLSSVEFLKTTTTIIVIWIIISLVATVIRWIRLDRTNKLEARLIYDLKQRYYNHILQLSTNFHTTHKTGSLLSRLGRASGGMERMTDFIIFNTLSLLFELIISGVTLFAIDIKIGLTFLVSGAIFAIYSAILQKIERNRRQLTNEAEDIEKGFTSDTFTNISSIKYYGKEQIVKQRYTNLAEKSNKSLMHEWNIGRWAGSGQALIMGLGGLAVLIFAARGLVD